MGRHGSGVTWRSVVLGLLLACALAALTPYNDCVVGNSYIAGNHLPIGAVFVLIALSGLNLACRRIRGRGMFTPAELAVIYILVMASSGIASFGILRYLLPVSTVPYYYASAGNQWEHLFWGYIPWWLAVRDEAAVTWFWEGMPAGSHVPWGQWGPVLLRWFVLVGSLWVMMICLAALVRKQWADRERLAFPLVQFPYEVLRDDSTGTGAAFFGSRLLWIGAGVVFLVHLVNGLHQYVPAIPGIPTSWTLTGLLVDRPWSAAQPLMVRIYFSTIGVAYLLSLEVAAGFWFSVLLMKAQAIAFSLLGYEGDAWSGAISEMVDHEQMGALLMAAAVIAWLLRGTMADAFRKAFTRAPEIDDSTEPLGYRAAVLGLLAGLLVASLWLLAAGMDWLAIVGFLVSFLAICLVLTRIIAEAGMLMIHVSFYPLKYLLLFGGPQAVGARNMTVLTFVDSTLTFDLRELLMPSVLNSFRLAEESGLNPRRVVPWIGAALVLVLLVATPAFLTTVYKRGAAPIEHTAYLAALPRRFFATLGTDLQSPSAPQSADYLLVVAGAGMVAALAWMRLHFVWWPIHPLGFVMATSYASLNLWFSLFLGWLFKLLTMRYSGLRGYTRVRPLFLGVIVGDILGGVLWMIVGLFTGRGVMVTLD